MKKLIIFLFIAASFSAISQTDSIGYVVYVKGIYDTKRHKITTIEKVTEKLNIKGYESGFLIAEGLTLFLVSTVL